MRSELTFCFIRLSRSIRFQSQTHLLLFNLTIKHIPCIPNRGLWPLQKMFKIKCRNIRRQPRLVSFALRHRSSLRVLIVVEKTNLRALYKWVWSINAKDSFHRLVSAVNTRHYFKVNTEFFSCKFKTLYVLCRRQQMVRYST